MKLAFFCPEADAFFRIEIPAIFCFSQLFVIFPGQQQEENVYLPVRQKTFICPRQSQVARQAPVLYVTGSILYSFKSRISFLEIFSCRISSAFSSRGFFESSIFAAIGIIGREEKPLKSPHFVSESR